MSFKYICDYYRVPAEVGRAVVCSGEPGVIVGSNGSHIEVLLDKMKPGQTAYYHPTWEVVYGDMKPVRRMTRSQQRYQDWLRSECNETFAEWMGFDKYTREERKRFHARFG